MGVAEERNHIGCNETPDMIAGTFFIPANARYYTLRSGGHINTFFIPANARYYTLRVEWFLHGTPGILNHPQKTRNHIGCNETPDMIAGMFFIAAYACDYTLRSDGHLSVFFILACAHDYTLHADCDIDFIIGILNHPRKLKNHIGYQKAPDMIAGTFFIAAYTRDYTLRSDGHINTFFIAAHARDYTFRVECIRKPRGR